MLIETKSLLTYPRPPISPPSVQIVKNKLGGSTYTHTGSQMGVSRTGRVTLKRTGELNPQPLINSIPVSTPSVPFNLIFYSKNNSMHVTNKGWDEAWKCEMKNVMIWGRFWAFHGIPTNKTRPLHITPPQQSKSSWSSNWSPIPHLQHHPPPSPPLHPLVISYFLHKTSKWNLKEAKNT